MFVLRGQVAGLLRSLSSQAESVRKPFEASIQRSIKLAFRMFFRPVGPLANFDPFSYDLVSSSVAFHGSSL